MEETRELLGIDPALYPDPEREWVGIAIVPDDLAPNPGDDGIVIINLPEPNGPACLIDRVDLRNPFGLWY